MKITTNKGEHFECPECGWKAFFGNFGWPDDAKPIIEKYGGLPCLYCNNETLPEDDRQTIHSSFHHMIECDGAPTIHLKETN